MAEVAVVGMGLSEDIGINGCIMAHSHATTCLCSRVPDKRRSGVGMLNRAVGMTRQATDGQIVIHDYRLDVGITARDIGCPCRIMTQSAVRVMEGENTCPVVCKDAVALVTGLVIGQVSCPHLYRMARAGMTSKVSMMTAITLAASIVTDGAADEMGVIAVVAGLTPEATMRLASRCKRAVGGGAMATNTVGGGWGRGRVHPHQGIVVLMSVIIKECAMAVLTII